MPSDRVRFLTLDEVLAIHERLVEEFGGPPGVREHRFLIRLLESGKCDFEHLVPWLRGSLAKLTKRS